MEVKRREEKRGNCFQFKHEMILLIEQFQDSNILKNVTW